MRTLLEILESAKDGDKPTHDECYFAMLALDGLSNFTSSDLRRCAFDETYVSPLLRKQAAEQDHRRWKAALNVPPDRYLGPRHTPGTPEHTQLRRVSKRLLSIAEDRLSEKEGGTE